MTEAPPPATSPGRTLALGARGSRLARAQAEWVADWLRAAGRDVQLVEISTLGDASTAPLTQIGGTGVFASAIRQALRAGEVDLAVHSLKDLPVAPDPELAIAAIPPREDPRDALVARDGLTVSTLPAGARVGTGSPRRAAQLTALRPDLVVTPIRGNVETRIGLVRAGRCDAVLLAAAGLARLGLSDQASEHLEVGTMLPAPGQGALAVECRAGDLDLRATLAALDDPATRSAVEAERAVLGALGSGCASPVGAWARPGPAPDQLELSGFLGSDATHPAVRRTLSGDRSDAVGLGQRLAAALRDVEPGHPDERGRGGGATGPDGWVLGDQERAR